MSGWEDLVARVRGLTSRLLGRDHLALLAASRDLRALALSLADSGYGPLPEAAAANPAALEHATRRVAAERLRVVEQWSGERSSLLVPMFEDEDRRNLRAIIRGIAAGTPVEQRVSGLLASPSLPEAMLDELARSERITEVAAMLIAWGNPYGGAIASEATRGTPDLFRLQFAIDREYASRALYAGRWAGDSMLNYVRQQIDVENVWSAMARVEGKVAPDVGDLFIDGGLVLSRERCHALSSATDAAEARTLLEKVVAGTPLAPLAVDPDRSESAEDALLGSTIRGLRRRVRVDPLGVAAVLEYGLRLRAEVRDLARITWGIVLDAPRARLAAALVTP